MAVPEANNKILIIGAGPGGLVLAQILRGVNIPFEIFERDPTLTSRKQGWAVALVECLPDLEALLPSDLGPLQSVSVNCGLASYDSLGVLNAKTGELIGRIGAVPRGEPGYVVRANREHFRQYLLQNLEIKLDKNLTHYEQDRDGVTAFFADGSSARGAILVGADGGHSHVRKQLLGKEGAALVPSAYIPMISETVVPYEQFEPYHKIGSAALLANGDGLRFLTGLLESLDGGSSVRYYSAVCFKSQNPAEDAEWATHATKQELFDKSLAVLGEKGVQLREAVVERVACLGFGLDASANAKPEDAVVVDIGAKSARHRVLVCQTDEQTEMARQCAVEADSLRK